MIEEEEMTESTIPGDMTSAIRCDLGMSPHVNIFGHEAKNKKIKAMQVLSVGTC